MKVQKIQEVVEREPFQPFGVRLSNGAKFNFKTRRDLGATKDCLILYYFADSGHNVRIDADSIVEIVEA